MKKKKNTWSAHNGEVRKVRHFKMNLKPFKGNMKEEAFHSMMIYFGETEIRKG